MSDRLLVLHVGYPKTATTSLQNSILPGVRDHGFFYSGNGDVEEGVCKAFKAYVHGESGGSLPAIQIDSGKAVLSNEGILFDCFRFFDERGQFAPRNLEGLAARCHSGAMAMGFAETRILIVLRRQRDLMHSLFAQAYTHYFRHVPGMQRYEDYVDRVLGSPELSAPYDYARTVEDFQNEFGKAQVRVLVFEDLKRSPEAFIGEIEQVIGAPLSRVIASDNVRASGHGRLTQRASLLSELHALKRRYFPGVNLRVGKHLGFLERVSFRRGEAIADDPEIARRIEGYFVSSNRRLAGLIDRDLSEYGYF